MSSYSGIDFISSHPQRLSGRTAAVREPARASAILKRIIDVTLAFFGLIVASPLLLIIGLAVWLESPGPALYRSPRAGRKGRFFTCYKFRTMVANANQEKENLRLCNERSGPFFKMANDPRTTKLGRFLRCYSLDELPQLWNVLRGEMSLVGPRPHPLDDVQRYEPGDLRRLEVTPGLTGLWQVTARSDPSFRRNMALDLEYIAHRNFWMDMAILYKTIFAVLQGTGA